MGAQGRRPYAWLDTFTTDDRLRISIVPSSGSVSDRLVQSAYERVSSGTGDVDLFLACCHQAESLRSLQLNSRRKEGRSYRSSHYYHQHLAWLHAPNVPESLLSYPLAAHDDKEPVPLMRLDSPEHEALVVTTETFDWSRVALPDDERAIMIAMRNLEPIAPYTYLRGTRNNRHMSVMIQRASVDQTKAWAEAPRTVINRFCTDLKAFQSRVRTKPSNGKVPPIYHKQVPLPDDLLDLTPLEYAQATRAERCTLLAQLLTYKDYQAALDCPAYNERTGNPSVTQQIIDSCYRWTYDKGHDAFIADSPLFESGQDVKDFRKKYAFDT